MNATASASVSAVLGQVPAQVGHVFADWAHLDGHTVALTRLVDPVFLTEIGWDQGSLVLFLPPGHRLLGRPVCRAAGCAVTAPQRGRVCAGCQRRLAEGGLGPDRVVLAARARPDRDVGGCVVPGCARTWASGPQQLCRQHVDQRRMLGLSQPGFLAHPQVQALPACGPCEVAACPRQRRHHDGRYCEAHQIRLRGAAGRNPRLDEDLWRATEPAVGVGGQVSLRGQAPLVIAGVLLGLQQRCRLDRVRTKEADLRSVCDDLRRQQVASIGGYHLGPTRSLAFAGLVNALSRHARRALSTPAIEAAGDEWDLAVFGHFGTVSFTGLTQAWLGESANAGRATTCPGDGSVPAGGPAPGSACATI